MKKNRLYRILFVIAVTLLALLLVYFAFIEMVPDLIPLLKNGDEAEIETYLKESSTFKGVICTALLQMVQVWSIFISGVPIQVAAGIVYGVAWGFVICMLSSVFAHYVALLLWRRMGKRMEKWMPVDGQDSKVWTYISKDTPPVFVVILACLIPVMPNGVIPIMAAKTDISPKDYLLAILGGTAVNIVMCCAVGKYLIMGSWIAAGVCVLALLFVVILLWIYRERVLKWAGALRNRRLAQRQMLRSRLKKNG